MDDFQSINTCLAQHKSLENALTALKNDHMKVESEIKNVLKELNEDMKNFSQRPSYAMTAALSILSAIVGGEFTVIVHFFLTVAK